MREGRVKNLKKWVMSFMDGLLSKSFPLHNFYKTFSINFFSPLFFLLGPLLWIWRSIHSCSWARHLRIHSATYRLALWGADAWLCPRGFQVENVSDIFDVCLCVCSSIFMVTHLVQGLPHQTEQFLMKNLIVCNMFFHWLKKRDCKSYFFVKNYTSSIRNS